MGIFLVQNGVIIIIIFLFCLLSVVSPLSLRLVLMSIQHDIMKTIQMCMLWVLCVRGIWLFVWLYVVVVVVVVIIISVMMIGALLLLLWLLWYRCDNAFTSSISHLYSVNVYTHHHIHHHLIFQAFQKKKKNIRMSIWMGIAILSSIFALDLSLILKVIPWSTAYYLYLYTKCRRHRWPFIQLPLSTKCLQRHILTRQIQFQILSMVNSFGGFQFISILLPILTFMCVLCPFFFFEYYIRYRLTHQCD